jgi:hypothetical protein
MVPVPWNQRPPHICVVFETRRRVHHWHWPKWDIVNCTKTVKAEQGKGEDRG